MIQAREDASGGVFPHCFRIRLRILVAGGLFS
jgi:hypothetical protein